MRMNGSPSILSGSQSNSQVADMSRKYAQIYMEYMRAQNDQAAGNALAGDKLMSNVMQRFRAFDRTDMPLYHDALAKLIGKGN